MISKRGTMAWDEILGLMLAAATVLVLIFLMFKLLAPGVDVNKEYAEGVFAKLEVAAAEAKDGKGEFSILDVPVEYGDSVFLVLFKGEDQMILSNYSVEIRNSGFMTYVEKSAVPVLMTSRRAYYNLLKTAKVPDDVALKSSDEIAEKLAIMAAENVEDILFENDMRSIVKNFVTRTGGQYDADMIIKEVSDNVVGKGLSPEGKMIALKSSLGKYIPEGGKVGSFDNIDTFMKSADGLAKAKGNTIRILKSDVGFNLNAEKIIKDSVVDEDAAQALIKEMTDETFGEGLDLAAKKVKLRTIVAGNADDVVGLDDVLKKVDGIKRANTDDVLKVLASTIDDAAAASSDDLLKVAAGRIISVKAVPAEKITKEIIEETVEVVAKGAGKNGVALRALVRGSWAAVPKGRIVGLTVKAVGKVTLGVFIVWNIYEYYTVAHDARSYVLTALNQDKISGNKWVSKKLLQIDKEEVGTLCVCYVDDGYRRNRCSDCISFGKAVVTNPEDKDFWTFCNDITLEDKGSVMALTSTVKEGCISSIALTNSECNESASALKVELNTVGNDIVGGVASTGGAAIYGTVIGAIGGCLVGGVAGFFGGAGIGAIPGCLAAGGAGAKGGAIAGAAVGAVVSFQSIEFTCDGRGHIYLGKTTE